MANSDMSAQCEKEIACCLSWFTNFRTHEKEEFLKILLDKAVPSNVRPHFTCVSLQLICFTSSVFKELVAASFSCSGC